MQNRIFFPQVLGGVFAALVLLSVPACQSAPTSASALQITPPIISTNSPAPLPAATGTQTPTLAPSATFTATPETPTATPNHPETAIAAKTPQAQESFRSPDGKWQAKIVVRACLETPTPDDRGYEELRLRDLGTGQETLADSQVTSCDGLGAYGLKGYFWSDDSRFFYYTDARQGVPDGCGYWATPYLAFDTHTGKTIRIGGGAISPDENFLAAWDKNEIVIWDWQRGEIARTPVKFQAIRGPIAWSPDGQSIAFLQWTNYCPPGDTFLTRLDAPDFKISFAEKLDTPDFDNVRWQSQDELRLFTFMRGQEWRFVFTTKKLEPLAQTP